MSFNDSQVSSKRCELVFVSRRVFGLQLLGKLFLISKYALHRSRQILNGVRYPVLFVFLQHLTKAVTLKLTRFHYIRNMNLAHPGQPVLLNRPIYFYGYIINYHTSARENRKRRTLLKGYGRSPKWPKHKGPATLGSGCLALVEMSSRVRV